MISSVPKVSQDIISKFCELSVGRVLITEDISSDTCIGTCAAVITYNNRSLIITCYHIVYDEYLDGVPLYKLSFSFNDKKYTQHDISYLGSSKRFNISIFELKSGFVTSTGFHLSTADCYKNERIYLACFPLTSSTNIDHTSFPVSSTLYEGIITAAEVIYDTALVDISSPIPHSYTLSGGALFSQLFDYTTLLGIYIEAVYHEDNLNEVDTSTTTTNSASAVTDGDATPVSYILKIDDALYEPPPDVGPDAGEGEVLPLGPADTEEGGLTLGQSDTPHPDSHPVNTGHEQSLHTCNNNVKNNSFSSTSAYFITSATLIKLLSGSGTLMRPELKGDNKTPSKNKKRRRR